MSFIAKQAFIETVETYMREAIALEENLNDDGSINWDFVDADCFMRLNPIGETTPLYLEAFDVIADKIEMEMK